MASSLYSSMGRPPQPTPSPVMAVGGRSPSTHTSLHYGSPPPSSSSQQQQYLQRSPPSSSTYHPTHQTSHRSPSAASLHQYQYHHAAAGGPSITNGRSYSAVPSAAPTPPPELEFKKVSNPDVESLNGHLDDMMRIKEGVHVALGMPSRGSGHDGSGMFRSTVLLGALLSTPPTGMGPTVAWSEVEMRISDLSASVERCEAHWEVVKRAGQVERAEGFATAMRFGSEVIGGGNRDPFYHRSGDHGQHAAAASHSSIQRILPLGGRQGSAAPSPSSRGASLGGGLGESRGSSMTSLTPSHWTDGGGRSHYTPRDVSFVTSEELHWRSCQRKWFQNVEAIITEGKFALLEARRLASDWRDRCINWAGPLERAMADRNFDALLRAIGAVTSEAPQPLQAGFLKQAISDAKDFAQKMKDASEDGRAVIASQSDLAVWAYLDAYQPYLPVPVIMELRALAAKREEYKNRFRLGYPSAVETVSTAREAIGEETERKRQEEEDRLAREAANLRTKRAAQADALIRIMREFEASEKDVRQFIIDDERKLRIMTTKTAIESEASAMGIEAKRRSASQRRLLSGRGPGFPISGGSPKYIAPEADCTSSNATPTKYNTNDVGIRIPSPTASSSSATSPSHSTAAMGGAKRSPGSNAISNHFDAPTLGDKRKSSYALLNSRRSEPHSSPTFLSHQQSLSRIPMVTSRAASTADLLSAASAAASRYLSREGSPTPGQEPETNHEVPNMNRVLSSVPSRVKLSHGYSRTAAMSSITATSVPSSPLVKYSFRRSGGGPLDADGDDSSTSGSGSEANHRNFKLGKGTVSSLRDLL